MPSLARRDATSVAPLSATEAAALLQQASALAGGPAVGRALIAGKQLALLSTDCGDALAHEFIQAATMLGAHVAFVQPGLDVHSSPSHVDALARVLGKLYDAVECHHMPYSLVRRLGRGSGIPVFAGLASAEHPTAALVAGLDASLPLPVRRRCILQATLLASLA